MKTKLWGKKILFLSPAFFNYEKVIQDKLESMGAEVTYYDERAVKSAFDRALLKVFPSLFIGKAQKYYDSILQANRSQSFDYILIIKCDMVSEKTLCAIKRNFPTAKLCLYLWDSIKNSPGIKKKLHYFDYTTSFDRADCNSLRELQFRPLFYSDSFNHVQNAENNDYKYDVAFCGTIHSDRYEVLKKIESQCEKNKLKYYSFYYLQSKFIYYFYRCIKPEFKGVGRNNFSFLKKTHGEIAEIERSSKVIVDIQHPAQSGLTMRTIEMLGIHKKIITTNTEIINYDFYDPRNICVIDRQNPIVDLTLFETPYQILPEDVYRKYSLECWIIDVLGLEE